MPVQEAVLVPPRTDSGVQTTAVAFPNLPKMGEYWVDATLTLVVTAAQTDATDTLDVYIQHSWNPDSTTPVWDDFVHFTQIAGNGGAIEHIGQWSRGASPESELHADADGSLAVGVLQGPVHPYWRAKIVIAETNNASFTWALYGSGFNRV